MNRLKQLTHWRTARRAGGQAGLKAAPAVPALSTMTPTMLSPLGARGSSSAMFGSWPKSALERVSGASRADARAATSRDEEIARRAFCAGFPVPRWCTSVRLAVGRTAVGARVALSAVAASGLRPSRAVFNRLRP